MRRRTRRRGSDTVLGGERERERERERVFTFCVRKIWIEWKRK